MTISYEEHKAAMQAFAEANGLRLYFADYGEDVPEDYRDEGIVAGIGFHSPSSNKWVKRIFTASQLQYIEETKAVILDYFGLSPKDEDEHSDPARTE
jgi:hypothetical protein